MDKTIKQDDQIMKLLNVSTMNRIICNTDKGYLTLQIRKGERSYGLVLDSVPLNKDDNEELMKILFPSKELEVQQVNKEPTQILHNLKDKTELSTVKEVEKIINEFPKKKGRPAGSKNK